MQKTRPLLTEKGLILRAKREEVCEQGNPKSDILEIVHSEEVPLFNPAQAFLDSLPQWDGQNHVARLFSRLPGVSSEQLGFLAVWLRSTVAHWLQMDTLHGNECVPTLIGPQGCGKTTFLRRLLPQHLRQYYLDHLNLGYMAQKDIAEMVEACFRKPNEGELVKTLNSTEMLKLMQHEYPTLQINHSTKVHIGLAMKELGYEHTVKGNVARYKVVPLRSRSSSKAA